VKPYGPDVVNVRTQVAGYEQAVARFDAATKAQDATAAYLPLFEALSWAASIDYRVAALFVPDGIKHPPRENWHARIAGGEIVPALRWVRNAVHHDWADALGLDESGYTYPRTYPKVYFEWRWRAADSLPANQRTKGRDAYVDLLAGRPARTTLAQLSVVFGFVAMLLEPASPALPAGALMTAADDSEDEQEGTSDLPGGAPGSEGL
jgi:hypothetical protein